jgi:hypothetical protein
MSKASAVCALIALSGCGWWTKPERCELGSTSCDGASIRVCVPDTSKRTSDGTVATKWNVVSYCAADPVLGLQTCSVVSGSAVCVQATADGGVATAEDFAEGHYLRVHVDQGLIQSSQDAFLDARPMSASTGQWALVARAGDTAKDAALLRDGDDAWVWADDVTRLELVNTDGSVRSTRELGGQKARGEGLSVSVQALVGDLPPTVRLLGPEDRKDVPFEVTSAFGRGVTVVEPSAAALSALGDAMRRVTITASSAVGQVVFVSDANDHLDEDAGVDGDLDQGEAGVEDLSRRLLDARTYYGQAALWVDASPTRLEVLSSSSEEQVALARDVIRAVGEAVLFVSAATREGGASPLLAQAAVRLPDDFPAEVANLLKARLLPLLAPGEDVAGTWSTLHGALAKVGLARDYSPVFIEPNDSQAVADGFASAAGSFGAAQDFSDYVGALAVPEAYAVSPCDGFDGRSLEQLEVRQMTALVKLLAIYGLGLVDRSSFVACTGDVDGSLAAPGMLVHKPNGEAVTFASDAQAIRSPYYSTATRWAGTATRSGGEEIALLQLVYRDPLPELVRLRSVAGIGSTNAFQRQSGSFSLAKPAEGDVAAAGGGLMLIRSATRERFEGLIVGAVMGRQALGANVLPLVLFRFDKPLWQERAQ